MIHVKNRNFKKLNLAFLASIFSVIMISCEIQNETTNDEFGNQKHNLQIQDSSLKKDKISYLLNSEVSETVFKSDIRNLDKANGFRKLKLGKFFDQLEFDDVNWNIDSTINGILIASISFMVSTDLTELVFINGQLCSIKTQTGSVISEKQTDISTLELLKYKYGKPTEFLNSENGKVNFDGYINFPRENDEEEKRNSNWKRFLSEAELFKQYYELPKNRKKSETNTIVRVGKIEKDTEVAYWKGDSITLKYIGKNRKFKIFWIAGDVKEHIVNYSEITYEKNDIQNEINKLNERHRKDSILNRQKIDEENINNLLKKY